MKFFSHLSSFAFLSLLATSSGCVGAAGDDALNGAPESNTEALTAPPEGSCASLTPARTQVLLDQLNTALGLAEQEIASGNPTGSYPAAATYTRDHLLNARNEVVTLRTWLAGAASDGVPAVTNYVEGQAIAGYMDRVTTQLQGATWWASIRAVYHHGVNPAKGTFARDALYTAGTVGETANDLHHHGYRCYIAAYGL
jgi:hypothetical protein